MKVLSLLQPWASLVVLGCKKIETRSWNTKYRGKILIHASAGKQGLTLIDKKDPFGELAQQLLNCGMQYYDYPLGAIIGEANLSETFQFGSDAAIKYLQGLYGYYAKREIAFGDWSEGRWGWRLENAIEFPSPIITKGQLGIWEYNMPINVH